mmetsp:Transcript_34311/g.114547  ORF Transcript_34311/g.114547 Transcript_34311/m.114547 type:complete len:219 (-) Transcript_34311:219-875(-)
MLVNELTYMASQGRVLGRARGTGCSLRAGTQGLRCCGTPRFEVDPCVRFIVLARANLPPASLLRGPVCKSLGDCRGVALPARRYDREEAAPSPRAEECGRGCGHGQAPTRARTAFRSAHGPDCGSHLSDLVVRLRRQVGRGARRRGLIGAGLLLLRGRRLGKARRGAGGAASHVVAAELELLSPRRRLQRLLLCPERRTAAATVRTTAARVSDEVLVE